MIMAKFASVTKKSDWEKYIESGEWKCPKAELTESNPKGAHHWVAPDGTDLFTCIYCRKKRRFGVDTDTE